MLQKIKPTKSSTKQNDLAALSPFARKWAAIEKKQKRNKSYQSKIDSLYVSFQTEILPEEVRFCQAIASEARHLMTFIKRKSFTIWQQKELINWIENRLDVLDNHPFCPPQLAGELREEYIEELVNKGQISGQNVEVGDAEIEEMRIVADDLFGGHKSFSDEELAAFIRDPALLRQKINDFFDAQDSDEREQEQEHEDDLGDEQFFDEFFNQQQKNAEDFSGHDTDEDRKRNKLKSLFKASELNKLYKALANRLHPDKEKNQALKAHKSELMSQLAQAKKNKDAFTIISMYQQYIPDNNLELDSEISETLFSLLNEKLNELDSEYAQIKTPGGLAGMVWQRFGEKTKKAMKHNLALHLSDLEQSQQQITLLLAQTKTVKVLKQQLAERYEQSQFQRSPFDMLKELFEDGDFDTPF